MNWFSLDILRQVLMVAGAIVVAFGWKDQETVNMVIGILMSVATAIWQLLDHGKVQSEVKSLRTEVKSLKGLK
jgi:hypothetical protein